LHFISYNIKKQAMKNIHVIPTDKPSRICEISYYGAINDGKVKFLVAPNDNAYIYEKGEGVIIQPKNIYITNDEEIKDRNWYISLEGKLLQFTGRNVLGDKFKAPKVILTTDQDLIKDGVQAITDDFLEWFVKNPSCEKVDIEKQMLCDYCGQEHCDNLRCRGYKDSPYYEIIIPKEEPKQETLEEAVNAFKKTNVYTNEIKQKQERMYSEEEVEVIAKDAYTMGRNNILIGVFNRWIKQFKKK
jgi:hypothetical protein